jgi:hypothetical protein
MGLMKESSKRGKARESSSYGNISRRESVHSLGEVARKGIFLNEDTAGRANKLLPYREGSVRTVFTIRPPETNLGFKISEMRGLRPSESSRDPQRFTDPREKMIRSVQNLPGLWRTLCRKTAGGRLTRSVVVAGLCASVGAPVVAAAFASWGAEATAILNQMQAFGLGYLTNLVSDWLKGQPESDPADEDTVRAALSDLLMAAQSATGNPSDENAISESLRHLAVLLAEPVILGMIITIAATDGKKLLELKPDVTDGNLSDDPAADDDWLLEEVVEALEDIARQPSMLETSLVQVYMSLQNKLD